MKDRDHFNSIIAASLKLFEDLVSSIENCDVVVCKELWKSQAIADLCLASVSSANSLIDNYVKRPGKSISTVTVIPLLHETVRPLVSLALKILKQNSNQKTIKSVKMVINKFRGESSAKEAMAIEAKSHFG